MDYLEKGSPVRQNIRQDVYNSTNFVGRVDAQSLESKSISTESLDIDFTDTLSYISEEDYQIPFGKTFLGPPLNWQDITISGDVIGTSLTEDDFEIASLTIDGQSNIPSVGLSFPTKGTVNFLQATSGGASGSSIGNATIVNDLTLLGQGKQRISSTALNWKDPISEDLVQIQNVFRFLDDSADYYLLKTNDAGENIRLQLNDSETGFKISNDLSDNTASVLRVEDNNGDAILEFFNDYLVSDTIPALDYADDAAAALGGVPVGGIYHNSGTIRIRLT